MADFRSKSWGERRVESFDAYRSTRPPGFTDLRCYSLSYAQQQQPHDLYNYNFKKGGNKTSSSNPTSNKWGLSSCLNDPELQRRKRIASYKMYGVEGRMKGSIKRSFRWLKDSLE
ncbi:uncharacterized protein LOC18443645 [Amborella trichopoda]|uniref:uncharacterized protein LOC18443645 n=1 Tax=Amborella trichopoda TaxID=13333 RepID=UPI0005D3EDE2|nr:uncharacterized protein LOC18443645 [Amborella trichopoda]|eukprot:XP_006853891.2 uncharacterized protein LOC18443645 [Amborella trichopoda]